MKSTTSTKVSNSSVRPVTSLLIEPTTLDFGEVNHDESLTARFRMVNTSLDEIQIDFVAKSCSCSDAVVESKVIPPGGQTELSVRWRLAGKRGRATETIAVHYRTRERPQQIVTARIVAKVRSRVEADTELIEFARSTKSTKVVALTSRGEKVYRVTGAAANHGSLAATIDKSANTVTVTYDPDIPGWDSGQLRLVILTDCPEESEIGLPVHVRHE